jgi:hypothetical protein
MARRRLARSRGHRADQTGLLLAGGNIPLTFQRTLVPRPTMDQALVSGLSLATNHAFVALVQETIQSVALLALGRRGHDQDDEEAWSRATIVADLVAAGLAEIPDPPVYTWATYTIPESIVRLTPEGMAWVTRARTSEGHR